MLAQAFIRSLTSAALNTDREEANAAVRHSDCVLCDSEGDVVR